MAEVIFSAVVGDLAGRVISHLVGQFNGEDRRTEAKLRRICHMLVKVHSAIEEARGRQIMNCGTLEWLSELYDGLYQGRYLLNTVGCREQQEETEEDEDAHKVVAAHPFSFSSFNPAKRVRVAACSVKSLLSRREVGAHERIDRVVQILETISGDLKEFLMLVQNCQPIRHPLATNILIEGQMFGRHVERERIINFLLHDGHGKLHVLPIVGGMGVGKTTLAQHVCDDERVYSTCVARALLLVITSNRSVASLGTVQPINLKVMRHPEYWFFFKAYAFAGRDVEENPRMVAAGKAIARKLNKSFGAKIVGAVLKAHPDPRFWCKVLRSNIGGLSLLGDGIGHIADLAENLLPGHVDMCKLSVSKSPYASQTELARLGDLRQASPGADCLADEFAKVVLCRPLVRTLTSDLNQSLLLVCQVIRNRLARKLLRPLQYWRNLSWRRSYSQRLWPVGDLAGRVISHLVGQFNGEDRRTEAKLRRIFHMLTKVHSAIEEARGRQITNYGTLEWLSEICEGLYQDRYLLDMVGCREEETEDEHADKVVATHPFSFSFNPVKRVHVAACRVKSLLSRHDVGDHERIDKSGADLGDHIR
ncbi:unnamed protein product [Alopecurus aequalis]